MTDIGTMPDGPEMNALIATKVMGWKASIDKHGEWVVIDGDGDRKTRRDVLAVIPFVHACGFGMLMPPPVLIASCTPWLIWISASLTKSRSVVMAGLCTARGHHASDVTGQIGSYSVSAWPTPMDSTPAPRRA